MKSILAMVLLTLSFTSFTSFAGVWTEWGKVSEMQTYANNSFRFKLTAPFVQSNAGSPCGSSWYVVSDFTGYKKEQISMLMMAYSANNDIRVNVSGCGGFNSTDTVANYFYVKK